jgi:Fur family peroxide stress response transcriptional regulator
MTDISQEQIQSRLERFVEVCRQKGLKITPQRLEIFRELASTGEHPTAEALFNGIKARMPTVSLDTVYRTLNTLQGYGLVTRVEVLDERSRYDANLNRHHHLICVRCEKVEDLYWSDIDRMPLPAEVDDWGHVHQLHAELRGLCRACLAQSQDGDSP